MIHERVLWNALGAIRQALEETLAPGAVRSVEDTEPTVQAEVEALTQAIRDSARTLDSVEG